MVTLAALVGNKSIWGAIAVFFCFTMISGQKWNHMRGPPFASQNGYIHGSSNRQFWVETFIVLGLNALIFFGMVLLTESGSQTDPRKGCIMSIVGLALIAIFFSLLLSVFRSKLRSYPYSFLFK